MHAIIQAACGRRGSWRAGVARCGACERAAVHHEAVVADHQRRHARVLQADEGRHRAALGRARSRSTSIRPTSSASFRPWWRASRSARSRSAPRPTASGSASSRASRCSTRPACSTTSPHGNKMLNDPGDPRPNGDLGRRQGRRDPHARHLQPADAADATRRCARVADFQGQKVRTQGGAPIQVEPLKKLGVIPVSLPLGEALPAMQNRTIDGMVGAAAPYVAFKYYDIAKPMTYLPATLVCRAGRRQPAVAEVARARA